MDFGHVVSDLLTSMRAYSVIEGTFHKWQGMLIQKYVEEVERIIQAHKCNHAPAVVIELFLGASQSFS